MAIRIMFVVKKLEIRESAGHNKSASYLGYQNGKIVFTATTQADGGAWVNLLEYNGENKEVLNMEESTIKNEPVIAIIDNEIVIDALIMNLRHRAKLFEEVTSCE